MKGTNGTRLLLIQRDIRGLHKRDSRQLQFPTVTQPFDDACVAFDDRRRFTRSKRLLRMAIVDVIDRPARIDRRHVRKEDGAVRGATVA